MDKSVLLNIEGAVAHLIFNRPFAMNSFNGEMSEDLLKAVETLHDTPSVRAVLMRGQGKCFMAGGDVKALYEGLDQMPGDIHDWADNLHRAIFLLRTLHAPVVAAVHGSAAGAGVSILLAADITLASSDCIFNMAYTHLGVSPDGGATYHLPRAIGYKRAMELLLLSERFDATEALNYGIINKIIPQKDLLKTAEQLTKQLSQGPTLAFAKVKKLMHTTWNNDLITQMNLEADFFTESTTTADFRAGVSAFVNKKQPKFNNE